jgi:hypothetical protein
MNIASFADLLTAARAQAEKQQLLFVFVGAGLPAKSTADERRRFEAGKGGELTPLMAADKSAEELADFAALELESRQFDQDWAIVFVATLAGRGSKPPADAEIEAALQRMVEAVKSGAIDRFIPFDRTGTPVRLVPR